MATWLCTAARSEGGIGTDDEFWYAAAAKLLAPLLRAAAHATWGRDERLRSSVYTTAELVVEAWADPSIAVSANTSDIQPERLLAGGAPTLFLCAPSHEQTRLRPAFATLLQQVITAAYERAARSRPLDPPLLIVIDEAANVAPIRDLDALAATAAGHGIQLVTVWQDLAQVHARYGQRAPTIINNHRAKLLLSGLSDEVTLAHFSRLLGEADELETSITTDRRGGRQTTMAPRPRRLATEAELRRLRPGEAVLVYGHLPPARLRLRWWWTDRELRNRARAAHDIGSGTTSGGGGPT
jgi:type IV secretion system protein VirD4